MAHTHKPLSSLFVLPGLLTLALAAGVVHAQTSVTVAGGVDVTQGFWIVAKEKGFGAKNGLDITTKTFESGSLALEAVIAGEAVAAGTSGGLPTLRGKAKGAPYLGVAAALRAPVISCAVAVSGIDSPQDLQGKAVGLMLGSSSEFWWSRYVAHHGIENVTVKNLSPPETITAIRGGDVAAFFNWQPWCRRGEEIVPGAHVLTYGGDDNLQPYADAMISFHEDFVKNQREAAIGLLKAVDEALQWISENPEEAAKVMAVAFRGDAEQFTRDIKDIEWGLRLDDWLRNFMYDEARWMKEKGMIDTDDPVSLVDSYLYSDLLAEMK